LKDKFIKAGNWLWYSKELIVLLVMVGILVYRVYGVVNPPPPPQWPPLPRPQTELPTDPAEVQTLGLPGDPTPRPPMDVPGTYSMLYNRNPFWYYSGQQKQDTKTEVDPKDLNIKLLDIQNAGGKLRAKLRTGDNATKWYSENDQFEKYELQKIDPDSNTVEIYSERFARTFTLSKE
jgi:hypothetical protein